MATSSIPESWHVTRLSGALGAEITGLDLATTTAADIKSIESLLLEHLVLFFPAQSLSKTEHIAFGRHFGELEGHPNLKDSNNVEFPELFELVATQGGVADEWHTDITFSRQSCADVCIAYGEMPGSWRRHHVDQFVRCL
jgi:taurine dioxygenase